VPKIYKYNIEYKTSIPTIKKALTQNTQHKRIAEKTLEVG
jgi:hypothetical protein